MSRRVFLRRAAATGAVAATATLAVAPKAMASSSGTIALSDHGATGDGRTDDTSAMQSALNAAGSGTTVLGDPSATYLVSSTLSFPADGVTLDLQGASVQIGSQRASGSQLATNDTIFACVGRTNVRITGGSLLSAASTFSGSGMPYRIQIAGGSGCRADSMSAQCDGSAFAFVTGSGHQVDHNQIQAGSIVGWDTTGLLIMANTLDASPSDAIAVSGFSGGGCSGTQYIDNIITGYGRIGIEDYCPDGPALSISPIFRGNQISAPSASNTSGTGISAMATAATISDNTITDARGWAIEANGLGTTITGNTLSWSAPSAAALETTGIVVNTSDPDYLAPVLVHGNEITGAGSAIVMFGDCFYCPVTIAGNSVTDPLSAGIILAPAQAAGGVSASGNSVAFTRASWQNLNRIGIKSERNALLGANQVTYSPQTYTAGVWETPYFFVGDGVSMIGNVSDGGGRSDGQVVSSTVGGVYTGWNLSANQFIDGSCASFDGLSLATSVSDDASTAVSTPAASTSTSTTSPAPQTVATSGQTVGTQASGTQATSAATTSAASASPANGQGSILAQKPGARTAKDAVAPKTVKRRVRARAHQSRRQLRRHHS